MNIIDIKYYKYIFLSIILSVLIIDINAQNTEKELPDNVKIDTSEYVRAKIDDSRLDKYKEDDDFNYKRDIPEKQSFWSVILHYLRQAIDEFFRDEGAMPYVRYLIAALVIGLIIYQILKRNIKGLFFHNKSVENDNQVYYNNENIYESELDSKLKKAIADNNFRLAVRYYYIVLLKYLDQKELIKWKLGKTNREYKKELRNSKIYKQFSNLLLLYEYSWYGNFEILEHDFISYSKDFENIFEKLGKGVKNKTNKLA